MKNLFDYATKELSQDAFLRWFFESYEDEQIGPIVVDFINYFTKNQYDGRESFVLDNKEDILQLKTKSQVEDIDVVVDFTSKKFRGHRTIVIEDKTDSEEHNQLEAYNTAISKWKYENNLTPQECVYKIFYKTHAIDQNELDRVRNSKWTPFDIEAINNFFSNYLNKTNSQVLNDYINHIMIIHDCYNKVSSLKASEWNSINWETFFNQFMGKYKDIEHDFTSYRGIYDSMMVYFNIPNGKYLNYVAFEIQIRGSLNPYLHPGFHVGDRWKWSASDFEGEEIYDECKDELLHLRAYIESNSESFIKRANTTRSFGKINEKIDLNIYSDELIIQLSRWIDELKRLIESYKPGD